MWRMHDGDRVLTDAEWAVFRTGLDVLRDAVESDLSAGEDDTAVGVAAFDRLTAGQKLGLLAAVASAVRDPAVPPPAHTAASEAAIMAVLYTFQDMLRDEVQERDGVTELRNLLLAAVGEDPDRPRRPKPSSRKWEAWGDLFECLVDRVLWDHDYDLGDEFLDLPPDEARVKLALARIDPAYFLDTPDDPTEPGLNTARRTLARLIGLPVPDEDGLYTMLDDLYHGLWVGPVTVEEEAAWADHPWVQVVRSPDPADRDCDYQTWRAAFGAGMPAVPFRLSPTQPGAADPLSDGRSVERYGGGWAVRDAGGSYWCGLLENCWTGSPDEDMPPLLFPTEADARAAFAQADRMYAERATRYDRALERLEATGN